MKSSLLGFFAMICLALAVCASVPQQKAKADDSGGYDAIFNWEADRPLGAPRSGIHTTFWINYYDAASGGNFIDSDIYAAGTSNGTAGYNSTYTSHAPNGALYFTVSDASATETGYAYDYGPSQSGFRQVIVPGGTNIPDPVVMK